LDAIIHAENLCYSYTGVVNAAPAVSNVSLDIERGSFVAILGHNGSGKSTLAKLFSLILQPTSGTLVINGKNMTAPDITEDDIFDVRKNIGMVFQNPDNQLVATIVEEDVAFGPENLGLPPAEIRRRVDESLKLVGMTDYARHAPHKLSGGQKQRVAIAGILAMSPDCIIFDESTAMLDPMGRREVMDIIESLNKNDGKTIICITHYMTEATRADRIIVMAEGKVFLDGAPKEIFAHVKDLWDARLDVPQTVELLYGLKQMGADVPTDIFDINECADAVEKAINAYAEKVK
jgi:energy-coupling factor transport system ATP-binding protein